MFYICLYQLQCPSFCWRVRRQVSHAICTVDGYLVLTLPKPMAAVLAAALQQSAATLAMQRTASQTVQRSFDFARKTRCRWLVWIHCSASLNGIRAAGKYSSTRAARTPMQSSSTKHDVVLSGRSQKMACGTLCSNSRAAAFDTGVSIRLHAKVSCVRYTSSSPSRSLGVIPMRFMRWSRRLTYTRLDGETSDDIQAN